MNVPVGLKWSVGLGSLLVVSGCQTGTSPGTEEAPTPEPEADASAEVSQEADTVESTPDQGDDSGEAMVAPGDGGYQDGTYRAVGGYQSPNGPETIEVNLTIADGVISAVEVIPQPSNSTTDRYQGYFAGGIAAEVVGKSLDEAEVTRVAGSSLTGGGFAEALETIRQDAKVG